MIVKRFSVIAWVVASVVLLGIGAAWAQPIEIEYWGKWGGITGRNVERILIEQFNKKYEGIYKATGIETNVREKLPVAVAANTPPDVVKIDRFRLGSYALMGILQPLDDLIAREGMDLDEFYPAAVAESRYEGSCFAIPWTIDDRAMFYNVSSFDAVGLDSNNPPTTWEEVEEAGRKLESFTSEGHVQRMAIVPTRGNWGFLGWLWAAGGKLLDETGRKVLFNGPEGLKALVWEEEWLHRYGGAGAIDQAWNSLGGFEGGAVAMHMEGSFYAGVLIDNNPGLSWRTANPPRPSGLEDEPVTWSGGHGFAIPAGVTGERRQAAWEFIKFYTSHEAQVRLGVGSKGWIPALRSAATDDEFLGELPEMRTFVSLMGYTRFRPVTPFGDQFYAAVGDTQRLLVAGEESPEEILQITAAKAQAVLDEGWADPLGLKEKERIRAITESGYSIRIGAEDAVDYGDGAPALGDNTVTHGWNKGYFDYEFSVPKGKEGCYTLYAYVATWGDATRVFTIDGESFEHTFPGNNTWDQYNLLKVKEGIQLSAGLHTVRIAVGSNWLNLDYVLFVRQESD